MHIHNETERSVDNSENVEARFVVVVFSPPPGRKRVHLDPGEPPNGTLLIYQPSLSRNPELNLQGDGFFFNLI